LRGALADAAIDLDGHRLVEVLVAEATALGRAGSPVDARGLLRAARAVADTRGTAADLGAVALTTTRLGARFAVRRDEVVAELEHALAAVAAAGDNAVLEARLTAALARELQHSVATDRPRAGELSTRALELGRATGDAQTIGACLLARHDVLWTPGTASERADIAREIIANALAVGDADQHADGMLLLANALLEQGSGAFRATLDEYLTIVEDRGHPRDRYLAETRRACVLLLAGELDAAERSIAGAVDLGERVREPDTGNVAMSQRLELVRARGDAADLLAFADAAVAHWTGAPIHAHAVAAGFCARAGDRDAAAAHVAAVVDLGAWRGDRSYLWSVFVRELALAAIALEDRRLCVELLDDVEPVAASCGVNGAVVAFAGSHAHTAGLLAAALGRADRAVDHLETAVAAYARLGAGGWLAEARRELERVRSPAAAPPDMAGLLRREGAVWHVHFAGRVASVAHAKGLTDLAHLLARPNQDIHVLDLAGSADRSRGGDAIADREALASYRRRLHDIDDDLDEASRHHDPARVEELVAERGELLDELGRVTGQGGRQRTFANHPAERARKATTARIRDAIRRLEPVLPELAAHLHERVVTGTFCRYRGDDQHGWRVET
jgi:hypothetical protein